MSPILYVGCSITGSSLIGSFDWLMNDPVGQLEVDFFTNASIEDGIVPNARAPLSDIVSNIVVAGPTRLAPR